MMKKYLITFLFLIKVLALIAQNNTPAQNTTLKTSGNWQEIFYKSPAKVLPLLYNAAINHSGTIEKLEAAKLIAKEDVKLTRNNILSTVSLVSGYSYGTLPFFGSSTNEINKINAFALDARAQYSVGVSMNLPMDVLLGKRSTGGSVLRAELVQKQVEAERKLEESTIREEVIVLYQNLVLAKNMLEHYQEALQAADLNKRIADRRFKASEIQAEEQLTFLGLYNKAFAEQQEAKNKYDTALLLLEDKIGMTLNNLMTTK